jgi:DNA-binding CsgD family transcriptional regulator
MRALHDEVATRWPAHLWLARPNLAICEAEATRLSGGSDPEAWAKVASCFEDLPQPYVRAYARYREGEALLAARHGAQRARSVLQESHAIARTLDAAPLRDAVEAIAKRGRVELHDPAGGAEPSAARFGLSAREQEILGLVAAGMTNREIGERLFITEKTAGHHVSNVLAKLGVSRRAEAAAEAIRLGIGAPGA